MPLSITLPSTKPAAEIPIGEGTSQCMNYTWFDKEIEIPYDGYQKNKYSYNNYGYKANAYFGEGAELLIKNVNNNYLAEADIYLYNDNDIKDSISIVDGEIRLINPIHRPLLDGSSITFDLGDDSFIRVDGEREEHYLFNYPIHCNPIGYATQTRSKPTFIQTTNALQIVPYDNLVTPHNEDDYLTNLIRFYKVESDNDYIWISFGDYRLNSNGLDFQFIKNNIFSLKAQVNASGSYDWPTNGLNIYIKKCDPVYYYSNENDIQPTYDRTAFKFAIRGKLLF